VRDYRCSGCWQTRPVRRARVTAGGVKFRLIVAEAREDVVFGGLGENSVGSGHGEKRQDKYCRKAIEAQASFLLKQPEQTGTRKSNRQTGEWNLTVALPLSQCCQEGRRIPINRVKRGKKLLTDSRHDDRESPKRAKLSDVI
jgi:hypothetical protein